MLRNLKLFPSESRHWVTPIFSIASSPGYAMTYNRSFTYLSHRPCTKLWEWRSYWKISVTPPKWRPPSPLTLSLLLLFLICKTRVVVNIHKSWLNACLCKDGLSVCKKPMLKLWRQIHFEESMSTALISPPLISWHRGWRRHFNNDYIWGQGDCCRRA